MEWFVGRNGQRTGPFSPEQLRRMAQSGEITPQDLLWRKGFDDWVPAAQVPGIFPSSGAGHAAGQRSAVGRPPAASRSRRPAPPPSMGGQGGAQQAAPVEFGGGNSFDYQSTSTSSSPLGDYGPRIGAAFLDGLFASLVFCPVGFGLYFGTVVVFAVGSQGNEEATGVGVLFGSVLANCCSALGLLLYYSLLESSAKQATWGKQICGLKVTDLQGNRLTFGRAMGRAAAKVFLSNACFLGYLAVFFTEKRQTLHDLVAGTLVARVR